MCDGSDDDDIVPSNPDLLTQIDDILQPCLSCHPLVFWTTVLQSLTPVGLTKLSQTTVKPCQWPPTPSAGVIINGSETICDAAFAPEVDATGTALLFMGGLLSAAKCCRSLFLHFKHIVVQLFKYTSVGP